MSNNTLILPSNGAYTIPSAGSTAIPSPIILDAKTLSFTSSIFTVFPVNGLAIVILSAIVSSSSPDAIDFCSDFSTDWNPSSYSPSGTSSNPVTITNAKAITNDTIQLTTNQINVSVKNNGIPMIGPVAIPVADTWNKPAIAPPTAPPMHTPIRGLFNLEVIPYNAGSVIPRIAFNAAVPAKALKSLFFVFKNTANVAPACAELEVTLSPIKYSTL